VLSVRGEGSLKVRSLVPETVATSDKVMVVASSTETMVVPVCIPTPVTSIPADRSVVSVRVTVVKPLVVLPCLVTEALTVMFPESVPAFIGLLKTMIKLVSMGTPVDPSAGYTAVVKG